MKIIYLARWVENNRLYWEIETDVNLTPSVYGRTTFYYNDGTEENAQEKNQILNILSVNNKTVIGYNTLTSNETISDRWAINITGVKNVSLFDDGQNIEQSIEDYNLETEDLSQLEDFDSNNLVEEKSFVWYEQANNNTKAIRSSEYITNSLLFEKSVVFDFQSTLSETVMNPFNPITVSEEQFNTYCTPEESNAQNSHQLYLIQETQQYKVLYHNGFDFLAIDIEGDIYQWEEVYIGTPYTKISTSVEQETVQIEYTYFMNSVIEEFNLEETHIYNKPTIEEIRKQKHMALGDILPVSSYMYQTVEG